MAINDRNWKFLRDATGLSLPYNEMYFRYLRGLGHTGTLQQMIARSKRGLNPAPNSGNPIKGGGPVAPTYDADAVLWFAANVSGGGTDPDAATKQTISNFYAGLKTDGIYTLIDRMNLVAAHDSFGARLDLVDKASLLTPVGAPTFTAFRGYMGDGTAAHLNTNWNSVLPAGNFAQNSCGLSIYLNATASDVAGQGAAIGRVTSVISFIRPRLTSTNTLNGRAQGNASKEYAAQTTRLGFRSISRTTSTLTRGYSLDGLQSGTDDTATSTALINENFMLLRLQTTYANDRIAFWAAHGGLDDTQTLAFRNRVVTLLTALGAN